MSPLIREGAEPSRNRAVGVIPHKVEAVSGGQHFVMFDGLDGVGEGTGNDAILSLHQDVEIVRLVDGKITDEEFSCGRGSLSPAGHQALRKDEKQEHCVTKSAQALRNDLPSPVSVSHSCNGSRAAGQWLSTFRPEIRDSMTVKSGDDHTSV